MKISPIYSVTAEMTALIAEIESLRKYATAFKLPKPAQDKIQRVSLLKSSLFSARIEGNSLEMQDIVIGSDKSQKKREVFNIVNAIRFVDSHVKEGDLTKDILLRLHKEVLDNISSEAGHLRQEAGAIFNQAGIAVYVSPPPKHIPELIDGLLSWVSLNRNENPLILAFVSHLIFEKIHPFLDGNGRVGRLLIASVLKARGWGFTFSVPFEEYLDEHKDEYYFYLDTGIKDTNGYLMFMLRAFLEQLKVVVLQIEDELASGDHPFLPPRQEEIYNIIGDHNVASFDVIGRRFVKVPKRTLRYDLKRLVDLGLIEKSGETKGAFYRVKTKKS